MTACCADPRAGVCRRFTFTVLAHKHLPLADQRLHLRLAELLFQGLCHIVRSLCLFHISVKRLGSPLFLGLEHGPSLERDRPQAHLPGPLLPAGLAEDDLLQGFI